MPRSHQHTSLPGERSKSSHFCSDPRRTSLTTDRRQDYLDCSGPRSPPCADVFWTYVRTSDHQERKHARPAWFPQVRHLKPLFCYPPAFLTTPRRAHAQGGRRPVQESIAACARVFIFIASCGQRPSSPHIRKFGRRRRPKHQVLRPTVRDSFS